MGTKEYSQPASKSSWDSQDFGDVNMVVKMAHFHKSSRPQWVNWTFGKNFIEILNKIQHFSDQNSVWKCHLQNDSHFVSVSMC